jgi:hypothetical protein
MSHQGYQPLSTKDVVFVEGLANSALLFKTDATLRVKDLLARVEAICASSDQLSAEEVQMLFGQGIACEVLRPGATDWQQGRLQFNIGFESGIPAPKVPIAMKTATIEHARTATIDRPIVAPPVVPPVVVTPVVATPVVVPPVVVPPVAPPVVAAPAPVVTPPPTTASVNRASLVTPIVAPPSPVMVAEDLPELDLASFSNVTDHEINRDNHDIDHGDMDHGDIDHSDVFSLMEAADVTPLGDDFVFSAGLEGLEGLEALNFDADEPPSKSISSPWDLEELDGMLMLK